ncbi:hypothetical protein D9611_008318 [Ephemerocybe angulata]|uniref:Uncharacterized protein n=1 Tax=Ephemerocybe angulata TaxID=980116 RepID=A0A8H5BKN4_9AGAR|nr:hypothetical protein D9611_008318 [Tulosesus angulatus]
MPNEFNSSDLRLPSHARDSGDTSVSASVIELVALSGRRLRLRTLLRYHHPLRQLSHSYGTPTPQTAFEDPDNEISSLREDRSLRARLRPQQRVWEPCLQ